VLTGSVVEHHLDRMFPAVVDKGNRPVGLWNPIHDQPGPQQPIKAIAGQ
jgi:hypothetical protein